MPNPVLVELKKANTTLPIEVYNDITDTWQTVPDNLGLNTRGNVEYPLTGIPAGTYESVLFQARLKGAVPPLVVSYIKDLLVVTEPAAGDTTYAPLDGAATSLSQYELYVL